MNTEQLVDYVATKSQITKVQAKSIVESVISGVKYGLITDGSVRLGSIGTLSMVKTAERQGRHPQTGEPLTIKAGHRVTFRINQAFKREIQ